MAYCRNRTSKGDPCVALCNTFNSLCFKKASKNCFYEDYVLLRNQLLLLEYDEDDPIVSSKLYEVTALLTRYIEDVPKPIQETVEFVKDIHKKIFFLYGIASRDIRDNRKYPNSQELHLLLVRYVELEYEVLYNADNYSPEYQKQVEKRVLSLLLTILQDSESWKQRDQLEGNSEEICAMNTLHIMTRVRVEYKKQQNFIENIMYKLLRILNVLDKVTEMKNKNRTFQLDKLMQIPKVRKIFEYLQNRDYGLEDPNSSEDEIEEIVEAASPMKGEVADEVEEKFDVSSFAPYDTQKKVMTIDLIDDDEDFHSMVYFRPEVRKLDKKDKKVALDGYQVQISERTTSNISDKFDKCIQLNSVTTSTPCDYKPLNSRSAISRVFEIDDNDSDSDIEIVQDTPSIVNLENDSVASAEPVEQKCLQLEKCTSEVSQNCIKSSSELEDALLQCDAISDNEIDEDDEDAILNKYHHDADADDAADDGAGETASVAEVSDATSFPITPVICDNLETTADEILNNTNEKVHNQDVSTSQVICADSDSEKKFQTSDSRKVDDDRLLCNSAYEVNSAPSENGESVLPIISHKKQPCTSDTKCENQKEKSVSTHSTNLAEIDTLNENKSSNVMSITATNVIAQIDDNIIPPHASKSIEDFPAVEMDAEVLKEDHIKETPLAVSKVFESCAQMVSVTTANSSFTVATEESFINRVTEGNVQLPPLPSEYSSADAVLHPTPEESVLCHTPEKSVEYPTPEESVLCHTPEKSVEYPTPEESIQESVLVPEENKNQQASVEQKTRSEDCVVPQAKLQGDININTEPEISEAVQAACPEEVSLPCIADEQELEASSTKQNDPPPTAENKCDQDGFNESAADLAQQTSEAESLELPKTTPNLETSKTTMAETETETEVITTPPPTSYEHQTSSEDIEEYAGEFGAVFTDHSCSNNLDVLASVAAEQKKMENSIEGRRGKKKKGRKAVNSKKNVAKPQKKARKSELAETKTKKEVVVTRRVTRSSSAQLQCTKEAQDHPKFIPSAFMDLENLVTPTPNRVYNLIDEAEAAMDTEESLDEPFSCVVSENQQNSIDRPFSEIAVENPVFDEDTIEDGISLVSHKREQRNNSEVVISIPDSVKDFPGINYDILEQAEQFAETNGVSRNPDDGLNHEELSNLAGLSGGFYQSTQIMEQSDVLPKDDEVVVESSTNVDEIVANKIEETFEDKDIPGSASTVPSAVTPLASNKLSHSDLEVEIDTVGQNDARILDAVSHEIVIKEGEEKVCETNITEKFNRLVDELRTKDASVDEPSSIETTNFPPKKNRRRAFLNKTVALPVKKRKNYCRKNIIINKYEKKNIEIDQTSIGMEPTKDIDADASKPQEEPVMDEILDLNQHKIVEQTALDYSVSRKLDDDNQDVSSIVTTENEGEEVVTHTSIYSGESTTNMSESTVQVCSGDGAKENHISEEICELNVATELEITPNNKLPSEETDKNPQSNFEFNKEAQEELKKQEVNPCKTQSVAEIPLLAVEQQINSSNTKSVKVDSVAEKTPQFIIEEEVDFSKTASTCDVETPAAAAEEEINSYKYTSAAMESESAIEAPKLVDDKKINSISTESIPVNSVLQPPELAVEDEINSNATADSVVEPQELTVDEINSNETVDCVECTDQEIANSSKTKSTEAPELTVEETIHFLKAKSTEVLEFIDEEMVNSSKSKSIGAPEITVNEAVEASKMEAPKLTVEEAVQSSKTKEVPKFTAEEIGNSSESKSIGAPEVIVNEAVDSSKVEAPKLTVEEAVPSSKAKSPEVPKFTTEEISNSSKRKSVGAPEVIVNEAVDSSKMEAPKLTVEEAVHSSKIKSPEVPKFNAEEIVNSSKSKSIEAPEVIVNEAVDSSKMEAPKLTVEEAIHSSKIKSLEVPKFTAEEIVNSSKSKSIEAPEVIVNEAVDSSKMEAPKLTVEEAIHSSKIKSLEVPKFTAEEIVNSSKSKSIEAPEVIVNEAVNSSKMEAPKLTVEEAIHSSKIKSLEVPKFTAEEIVNSSKSKSIEAPEVIVNEAVDSSKMEAPKLAVEKAVRPSKTKSSKVPKFTAEEISNSSKSKSTEAPEVIVKEAKHFSKTKSVKVSELTVAETVNSSKTKSIEVSEFIAEEVVNSSKTKSVEAPELAVKEAVDSSKANSAEVPELTVEGEVTSSKTKSIETPELSVEEKVNCAKAESTEVLEHAVEEAVYSSKAKSTEAPELIVEEVVNSSEMTPTYISEVIVEEEVNSSAEKPEVTVDETINSPNADLRTLGCLTEAPECIVEEEIYSSSTIECVMDAPESLPEAAVGEIVSSEKENEIDQTAQVEPCQLEQVHSADLVLNENKLSADNFCEPQINSASEKVIQTCENNEVEEIHEVLHQPILAPAHETLVSAEKETPENALECAAEESDRISNEDNVSQTPPVLEKVLESRESSDGNDRKRNTTQDDHEFDNSRDARTMPTLEREISLNQQEPASEPIEDAIHQEEAFPDDGYPLLAAHEIEAFTEEVVECCTGDLESPKLLQSQEENINIEELMQTETAPNKKVAEQTKKKASKFTETRNKKIVKTKTNLEINHRDGNRRVLTKAALKAFQNPYVQLQKLPENYDYRRMLCDLVEKPKAAKIGEQRSKSQDNPSKRRKRNSRSLSESKRSKKHEIADKSESSKREKRAKQKERESRSTKSSTGYVSERDESSKSSKGSSRDDSFKTKTRSSSQKQRNKEVKPAEKAKVTRSLSESKIELKPKQNEILEKKSPNRDKPKTVKELQLFSVEDSKITYYDKRRKAEKESVKQDSIVHHEKKQDSNQTTDAKSAGRREEKSSPSVTYKNEEISSCKSPAKESSLRSSSRNNNGSSKYTRDKIEKEEVETQTKHVICTTPEGTNKSKNESSYSTRRHSRRSVSISKSSENTKEDKTKETGLDLKDCKENPKKKEIDKMSTSPDSNKLKADKMSELLPSDKNTEVLADMKKSSDHKRHKSNRSSSKNSSKSENKDPEDAVHEKKKPRVEKNKENVCSPKSETESDLKRQPHKKSVSVDVIEKNSNNLAVKVIVEPKLSKRERRELRSNSSREKSKIKSSLAENGSLAEKDSTVERVETCPLGLSEKPKEKLKESKKLPKKRRLSENYDCELEAKNSRKSTSSADIPLELSDCKKTIDNELSTTQGETEVESRGSGTDKENEEITNMQTKEPLQNKERDGLEKFNSAKEDFPHHDSENIIDAKKLEPDVEKQPIETPEDKKEEQPRKRVAKAKNTKLLQNSFKNLIQNQDLKGEESVKINCEVFAANNHKIPVDDENQIGTKTSELDNHDDACKMVIDSNSSEPSINNSLVNTSGEENGTLKEKSDSRKSDSEAVNCLAVTGINASTTLTNIDASGDHKKLEETLEYQQANRQEMVVDTETRKSLLDDDISNEKKEKLPKESMKENLKYGDGDVIDAKNTETAVNDDRLESKDQTLKSMQLNNHNMAVDANCTDAVMADVNIPTKKRTNAEKVESKKKDPKRIDFVIENLKNRNSKKKKELALTEHQLDCTDETEKVTAFETSNMEVDALPQILSGKEHPILDGDSKKKKEVMQLGLRELELECTDEIETRRALETCNAEADILPQVLPKKEHSILNCDSKKTKEVMQLGPREFQLECTDEIETRRALETCNAEADILPQVLSTKEHSILNCDSKKEKEVTQLAPTELQLECMDKTEKGRSLETSNMEVDALAQVLPEKEHPILNGDCVGFNNEREVDFTIATADKNEVMDHIEKISINQTKTTKESNDFEKSADITAELKDSTRGQEIKSCSGDLSSQTIQKEDVFQHPIIPASVSEINDFVEDDALVEKEELNNLPKNTKEPEISYNNLVPSHSKMNEILKDAELNKHVEKTIIDARPGETQPRESTEPENIPAHQNSVEKPQSSCFAKSGDSLPEVMFSSEHNSVQGMGVDASSLDQTDSGLHMIVENSLSQHSTEIEGMGDEDHSLDVRPRTPEISKIINDGGLIEARNSQTDTAFIDKLKVPSVPNHHFKETETNNENENCTTISPMPTMPSKNNAIIDHAVPSTSRHSMNSFAAPGVSPVVVETSQLPLLDVHKHQPEEGIVNLSTPTAETSTSCEITDNLIAVIFSNGALCNNTEVINGSERNRPNKTGFIYFRGTDHNYHSVGDPLLSGKCDNNESDHSSENSKEVPTPELENVLVDDNILPYIPTLTENNLNQELTESPVDSNTDFQLLEQCLIGNPLGRESSPPLPQGCDNLYQANLKQEVLEYDDSSASSNMEFSKESSEVYINQTQMMSVENMSELMNTVLTGLRNLNNMTRPTQRLDSVSKENLVQPVAAEFNAVKTTNTNTFAMPHNLESDYNFVPMQEVSNAYTHPEYSNISFGNEMPETVSFETDFTNFYYLPVSHDTALNKTCNKKVIVERIPQYSDQHLKSYTGVNTGVMSNVSTVSANTMLTNVNVTPITSVKQPEPTTRSSTKSSPVSEVATPIKPGSLFAKAKQIDISSEPVVTSTTINMGFVRTSRRTRVSAPKPKEPSDRRSVETRESEESGTEADRSFSRGNKSDSHISRLKVRADLGTSSNSLIDTGHLAKERSLFIIEDSSELSANKQSNSRVLVEESKSDVRKSNKQPKEKDTLNMDDLNKTQTKQPKEDVISVEDLNKLNARKHNSSSSKPQKHPDANTDKASIVKNQPQVLEVTKQTSVKDAKSQTSDVIASPTVAVQNKLVDTPSHSDMIDNVKRRKRKPVDYIERVDFSSIDKLLGSELENGKLPQRTRQKKEETTGDVSPRPKKRKQEVEDKPPKLKIPSKPLQETERTKVDAVSACIDPDVVVKPTTSIFEDSDDDIPKKKKSKPESRLEPESMNDLFDRLVKEGDINTIKNLNAPRSSKEMDPSLIANESLKGEVQKFNKSALDLPHASNARAIFNLEHKKPDAITPVKQIGVVNPIPRSSNVVRKEPPCNRNSYGGAEEGRNSSQYYPYYSERNRRSYPYSNRESNRSSHQGSSRRMEYQPHSSEQRYSSSQRSSSSGRRSSRHHSNSRSSTEQRNYNRYASAAATDLAWREDMKKKFPNMFKDEVYF